MFPDNPNPNRSLISFPGFPVPSNEARAFPGFPTIGIRAPSTPEDVFNYLDGWNQSQIYEIAIDNSLIDSELTNFPVLVNLIRIASIWDADDKHADISLTNDDRTATSDSASVWKSLRSAMGKDSGKWYFEIKIALSDASNYNMVGVASASHSLSTYIGAASDGWSYYGNNGKSVNNVTQTVYGDVYTTDDIIGVAVDLDEGEIYFAKNNTWQNSSDPVAGTGAAYTNLSGTIYPAASLYALNNSGIMQAEPQNCTYEPPTDYLYWNINPSYSEIFTEFKIDRTGEVLLIHSDTTDGSTTFDDSSASNHTVINIGNVHHEDTFAKFGATSIYFDGTGDYLSIADSDDFHVGTGDFILSFNFKRTRLATREYLCGQMDSGGTSTASNLQVQIWSDDYLRISQGHDATYFSWATTVAVSDYACHHFALIRHGNNLYVCLDGIILDTKDVTGYDFNNQTTPFSFGRTGDYAVYYFKGYMDEIRLVKGLTTYTEDFIVSNRPYLDYTIDEIVDYLAVTDSDGNLLPVEVQEWDENKQVCLLWVGVPTVSNATDTSLYLYYDKWNIPKDVITAKSVILDIADNYGSTAYISIRSVEFLLDGAVVLVTINNTTCYSTSQLSASYDVKYTFGTGTIKTGNWAGNAWVSNTSQVTNQRIICVFDEEIKFDTIVINNGHSAGASTDTGGENIEIYSSSDAISDTTYGAVIDNATLIFDNVFMEHVASDAKDDQQVLKVFRDTFEYVSIPADHIAFNTGITLSTSWSNKNHRHTVVTSDIDAVGYKAKVVFNDSASYVIDSCWIGHVAASGNDYDFDGRQVQVFFNGEAGCTVTQSGGNITSDLSDFVPEDGRNIVVSYYSASANVAYKSTASVGHSWYSSTVTDESGDTVPSTLTSYGGALFIDGVILQVPAHDVWDDNFKLVCHMNQDPSGGADCILDSTQNINHGTPAGTMLTEDLVDGVVGKAIEFDGSDDYIDLGSLLGIDSSESFSINMLLNLTSFTNSYGIAISVKTDTSENFRIIFSDQTSYLDIAFGSNSATFANGDTGNISFAVETTQLLTLTYNGNGASTLSNYKLYLDGEEKTLTASGAFGTDTTNALIGGSVATAFWEGLMDEVFVSWTTDSAAWVKANYNSLINNLLTIAKKV